MCMPESSFTLHKRFCRTADSVRHLRPRVPLCVAGPSKGTYSVHVFEPVPTYDVGKSVTNYFGGSPAMAASQVVLYFDRQEDALQFTLAASSIIADGAPLRDTALKVAKEVCKATRITAEGSLNAEESKKRKV